MPKYFIINLHRTGTKSADAFFAELGFKSSTWPVDVDGINYEEKVVGIEEDQERICDVMTPVIESHQVLSDVPFPAIIRQLKTRYEDSKFIYIYRNPFDWVKSVRSHYAPTAHNKGKLRPFVRALYWQYLNTKPTDMKEVSDRELLLLHAQHFSDALLLFRDTPEQLCVVDLNSPDIGSTLASFVGATKDVPFPHLNIGWHKKKQKIT